MKSSNNINHLIIEDVTDQSASMQYLSPPSIFFVFYNFRQDLKDWNIETAWQLPGLQHFTNL
jgi:hypothetical protein